LGHFFKRRAPSFFFFIRYYIRPCRGRGCSSLMVRPPAFFTARLSGFARPPLSALTCRIISQPQVAQQLCRLLTASPVVEARAVLGGRLERLPAALAALSEVRRVEGVSLLVSAASASLVSVARLPVRVLCSGWCLSQVSAATPLGPKVFSLLGLPAQTQPQRAARTMRRFAFPALPFQPSPAFPASSCDRCGVFSTIYGDGAAAYPPKLRNNKKKEFTEIVKIRHPFSCVAHKLVGILPPTRPS